MTAPDQVTRESDDGRGAAIGRVAADLAGTLVDRFDVVAAIEELSRRGAAVLSVEGVGVVVADGRGHLRLVAGNEPRLALVESLALETDDGPGVESFTRRAPVVADDLATDADRWPRFVPAALAAGFRSAYAVPLRLRGEPLGVLNLFGDDVGALDASDLDGARLLADLATLVLVNQPSTREREHAVEQVHAALTDRAVIEQATGMVAEQGGIEVADAARLLRRHAVATSQPLGSVAARVIAGSLEHRELGASS